MRRHQTLLAVASLLLPAATALAHPGHGLQASALPGLLHPLTGLDHFAALLAVGAWSATRSGAVRWILPAAFLATMAAGAQLAGIATTGMVELAIAGSLLALGLVLAGAGRLPAIVAVAGAVVLAFFHGHAHGSELPAGALIMPFTAGFALSSALVVAAGFAAGVRLAGSPWLRAIGAVMAFSGIALAA